MEYESVGCFKDSNYRAIESVEGFHRYFPSASLLFYDYKTRQQAIQKCAVFAKLKGYKMFGIQDGGMCVTSARAHKTYNKYGESEDCKSDGKGGPWANQVYRFPERKVNLLFVVSSGNPLNLKAEGLVLRDLVPSSTVIQSLLDVFYWTEVRTCTYPDTSSQLVNNIFLSSAFCVLFMQPAPGIGDSHFF